MPDTEITKITLECLIGLYFDRQTENIYVPTLCDTEAGYFVEQEPVTQIHANNIDNLCGVLQSSLSHANRMAAGSSFPMETLVLAPYLGVSTQAELEQRTTYFSIMKGSIGFLIESQQRHPDGTWHRKAKSVDTLVPRTTTYRQLAGMVIELASNLL
jgi:hypothetical protein